MEVMFLRYASAYTNKQINIHTNALIKILRTPTGRTEVVNLFRSNKGEIFKPWEFNCTVSSCTSWFQRLLTAAN